MTEHRHERDEFIAAASKFCELCENAEQLGRERFLRGLHRAQPRLQAAGAELPDDTDEIPDDDFDVGPTDQEMNQIMPPVGGILEEIDWDEIGYELHEGVGPKGGFRASWPISIFLYDDLYDIYHDLKQGFLLIDAGRPEAEAVFHWRWYFWSHWGYHNAEALRVIHYCAASASRQRLRTPARRTPGSTSPPPRCR